MKHPNQPSVSRSADGCLEWRLNGYLHREDGPAVIWDDWSEEWRIRGELHREDGPAVIMADGRRAWWRHGRLHREDGPAVIWTGGKQTWYLNGIEVDPIVHFIKVGENA